MLTLFCAVVGQKGSAFSIKIDASESVDALKDAIKQKNERTITCDARELKLFLAKKGMASDVTWLESSSEDVRTLKEGGKTDFIVELTETINELQGEFGLDEVLEGMPVPSTKEIHVLVVVPEVDQGQLYDGNRKRQRIENNINFEAIALTAQLKSFANVQLVERVIQSEVNVLLPYSQGKIKNLYVRECYEEVFHLLIQCISRNMTSFAISGTPGIDFYQDFVKQKKAKIWFFPVWTLAELQTCWRHCYPDLPMELLQERHRIYGGVARFVFHEDYSIPVTREMDSALSDVEAVREVKYVGDTTKIFKSSHILLHIMVGKDENGNPYQFTDLDVASEYVGEQLWKHHSAQMITNLQQMFGGSPNEISRHLFEIYGHRVFSVGRQTLKCRCLYSKIETEIQTETQFLLNALQGQRITFGKNTNLTSADLLDKYYEPTDDDNYPAIDSLSSQGMFQFTVAAEHPIRGVQNLRKLCELYEKPKLYFVVPPHRFAAFKKQKFKATTGSGDVNEISNLEQYVLELPVM